MTGIALNQRLANPSMQTDLRGLADIWVQHRIVLGLIGMGRFSSAPSLLNKVRGALGRVLLQMGSADVGKGRPCIWSDTCAAEGLFGAKPTIRIGAFRGEITKPYRLTQKRKGEDLIVSLDLYGFARVWRHEVKWALLFALREFVDWDLLAKDNGFFVPKCVHVSEPVLLEIPIHERDCTHVRLLFQSPVDAERGSIFQRPDLLFKRLSLRLSMLARWHEVTLQEDWQALQRKWQDFDYFLKPCVSHSNFSIGGHKFRNHVNAPQTIEIQGPLGRSATMLALGENTGLGRGAMIGLGDYSIDII